MNNEIEELIESLQKRLSFYIDIYYTTEDIGLKEIVLETNNLQLRRLVIVTETETIKNCNKILNHNN